MLNIKGWPEVLGNETATNTKINSNDLVSILLDNPSILILILQGSLYASIYTKCALKSNWGLLS